jgi:D-threo-aldose 1-dehydrogenase
MKRRLGRTGLELSPVGIGGVPLGEIYRKVPEPQARDTLDAAWDAGIRYYDTSPWYGRGLSELRFGAMLRQRARCDFVLSTKVGRTFHRPQDAAGFKGAFWAGGLPFEHRFDYTYDGIMRSYDQSLMRLGLNTVDLLLIHDLDVAEIGSVDLVNQHFTDLERSGWRALETLRSYGEIRGIGAGVNIMGTIPQFLARFDLDFFLVAMPYTLLDQEPLNEEFPLCAERGVGVIIGSPFASGILATGAATANPQYNYVPATPPVLQRVAAIEALCREFGIPLKAAAYQFPLRHPIVASVISGAESPEQARENAGLVDVPIPQAFWQALRDCKLVHPDSP